jgi:hypothetical protein
LTHPTGCVAIEKGAGMSLPFVFLGIFDKRLQASPLFNRLLGMWFNHMESKAIQDNEILIDFKHFSIQFKLLLLCILGKIGKLKGAFFA